MRPPVRTLALIIILSLLAGCTSDGYLGEIDEKDQEARAQARAQTFWRQAASAHPGDLAAIAPSFSASGGLAPISLDVLRLDRADGSSATHLALANATLDGVRGWLVFDANASATFTTDGAGAMRLVDPALRGDAAGLRAEILGTDPGVVTLVFGPCMTDAESEACRAWRTTQPPARPEAFVDHGESEFGFLELPAAVSVSGRELAFHDAGGRSRTLASTARVDTEGARLVGLVPLTNETPFPAPASVTIPIDIRPLDWAGNLTLSMQDPAGRIEFPTGSHALDAFAEVHAKVRGEERITLTREGTGWRIGADDVQFVDVKTDDQHRLGATLRLVPDTIEARGPAGNTTRIQLLLAETSQGADVHLTGYRIAASTNTRYIGYEPFEITEELIEAINDTQGPVTPFIALGIGIALPFVAIGEAFVAILFAFFPPSLAGPLAAGEGRALKFDLEVPASPEVVEILIEAENADPVRATIRLAPE